MNLPLFRKSAIDQQRERLHGELILTQPVSFTLIIFFLTCIIVVALAFLIMNDYSKKESVFGYLVPDRGVVDIFTPQQGLLLHMNVFEGMPVGENDNLFSVLIDQSVMGGKYIGRQLLDELNTQEKYLRKKLELEKERVSTELLRQEGKGIKTKKEIEQLQESIDIQKRILEVESEAYLRVRKMFRKGLIASTDVENVYRRYLEQKKQLQVLAMNMETAVSNFDEITINIKALKIDSEREMINMESELSEIAKQRATIEGRRQIVVRSPIRGRISSIVVSAGQRLNPSMPLFSIVPEHSLLEAHLFVPTRAIGFLEEGQSVNIRYDAFPFQKFGMYPGHITKIAKSIISPKEIPVSVPIHEPVYMVVATLKSQSINAYGKEALLKPGMILSADVILSKRSLFEWLLEPLYSLKGRL